MASNAVCVFPVLSTPITVEVLATDTAKVSIVGNKSIAGYTFYATLVNGGTKPTFQWRKNNVDIPGATGDTYATTSLNANDKISVYAGTSQQCAYPLFVLSNSILASEVTSVKSVAANTTSIQLFPNPNEGKFEIKASVKATSGDAGIEVLNAVGQVVFRNTVPVQGSDFNTNIDLGANAAAGMYMVRLNIDGQVSTLRFVVK
ncbi:T9SS type A sorting domain-containing protein [Polluticoccus soli]|uniref:T9SS type A sorting domain-containing protein n=1 Tax=Polluticoccus soli TaxID=3034150 RepID=UPI003B830E11